MRGMSHAVNADTDNNLFTGDGAHGIPRADGCLPERGVRQLRPALPEHPVL
jgi:hypothetical protein